MESTQICHSLLDFVEQQNLSEGDYLITCNALKDAFKKLNTSNTTYGTNHYTMECICNVPFTRVIFKVTKWIVTVNEETTNDITLEFERSFDTGKAESTPTTHSVDSLDKFKEIIYNICEAIDANAIILSYSGLSQAESYTSYVKRKIAENTFEISQGITDEKVTYHKVRFYNDMLERLVSFMKVDGFEEY